ncbi:AAA family ATPase [Desulfonatronovibrio magnus]|uniref:AAA family ATPase n=1 Tax=Desulfonatronovibrio magnus TaxID=698827 RepID=UPI000695D043
MNIKNMLLTNFRGAESLSLDFHDQLNVFVGVNGSGKSSVLDAAAIMLSWFVNRVKHSGSSGRPITESDIMNGKSVASLNIACSDKSQDIKWKIVKSRQGHSKLKKRSDFNELNEHTKHIQDRITEESENTDLPIMVYYPVNRAVLDIPLRIRSKHKFNLLAAYEESLTGGVNFRTFFEWFREREDLENEMRRHPEI